MMISLDHENKMGDYLINNQHFVLTIPLDLTESSEVRKAGDQSK